MGDADALHGLDLGAGVSGHLRAGRHARQVQQVVPAGRQARVRHRQVDGRRGRVSRRLQLSGGGESGERPSDLLPTLAAARRRRTAGRYRVADVELVSDHPGVVDGAGVLFPHFHHDMLVHRPPVRRFYVYKASPFLCMSVASFFFSFFTLFKLERFF